MRSAFAASRKLLALCLGLVCLGIAPAAAGAASDEPSVIEFTVPDNAAIDQLNQLGYDITEYKRPNNDGTFTISAVVTPGEQAQLEALGYKAGAVVETPESQAAVRAEADRKDRELADANANLKAGRTVKKAASAAADTVLASRADYFENYAGRFINIEARTSAGSPVSSQNPVMTASWDSGPGTELGGPGKQGTLSPYIDSDPPDANYYLYHRNIFRVGAIGDGPMPSEVRVASADGGVDTIPVKRWTSNDGKPFPAGYLQDFNTNYVDSKMAYDKITALSAEFPQISQVYDLPNKTNGYQRKAQTILGLATPYAGATGSLRGTAADPAVVLTSRAYGQNGGNDITAQITPSAGPDQTLNVSVSGTAITVRPATDATGAITSTAAQVVDAINANQPASDLVFAAKYRTDEGAGVVSANATPLQLSDFLQAPADYPRGPQTVKMLRIGAHRDGSKVGVFLYCQEHAREWATSLVCLETAERLLRNYATDPLTKDIVDNLDIFIVPVINADGVTYSRYDYTSQRKNMINYCASSPTGNNDPMARNTWGVDINRNFSVGSMFDGYVGASSSCTSEVFAGPGEFSEPESRNEQWIQSTFSNIKFANNIHSYGGYFMWPPGAYKTVGRETLPYASYGTNQFFDATAARVLDRIQRYRKTTVLPSRTGPVADVLYSAAGNSADEAYYNHGIIGYDFEIGVDRFTGTNANGNPTFSTTGFTPAYANEGHDEGMEFADGNIGMLEAALDYSRDDSPPVVTPKWTPTDSGVDLTFDQDEPADIYYTLDGSTPTEQSTHYQPEGPRQRVQAVHLAFPATLKWISYDLKHQTSGVHTYVWTADGQGTVGGDVPATLALTLGAPADFGAFTPGLAKTYTASTTATVVSTAGDATLSVADPSADHPGHLVNGAFALPQPLKSGGSELPATVKTYDGPVSNDNATIGFSQDIGAGDALRTGAYSKTLTFTLSTTTP
ncbi:MAG TPA: M14 family zinc carboxypeptidase [Solirubrobacter sp.]|nr:M14 family zinc carboxypeptidase [Solirubrobacter sp.]